ncbi:hypothetical protein BC833DRAFT_603853 [Globomyces pollinis-pini]|nr:hypothetical protein BC833DRAFT_603853 [Globomyces pollinis-pini]
MKSWIKKKTSFLIEDQQPLDIVHSTNIDHSNVVKLLSPSQEAHHLLSLNSILSDMDHLKLSNDIDNNPNYPSLNVSKSFSTLSPKRYSEGANVKKINNSSIDKEWKSLERSIDKMALKRYDNQTASMPKKKKKDDSSNIAKLHKHPEFAALEASLERSIDAINKTRFSNQSASFTRRPKLPLTPTDSNSDENSSSYRIHSTSTLSSVGYLNTLDSPTTKSPISPLVEERVVVVSHLDSDNQFSSDEDWD